MALRYQMRRVRKRLSETGQKVYNLVVLVYMEDLECYDDTGGVVAEDLTADELSKMRHTAYGTLLAYLDSLHVRCAVSPIHDRDTFTADDVWAWCERHIDPETGDLDVKYLDSAPYVGKPKKAHVHIMFMMRRQYTAEEMSLMMAGLLWIRPTMWDKCIDPVGMLRYFAHLDSPEKAQYPSYGIHGFGGIKLDALVMDDSKSKMHECTMAIFEMIDECGIRYYHTLMRKVRATGDAELIACVWGKQPLFRAYMKDMRDEQREMAEAKRRKKELERQGLIG